jgi:adenylate cyclase
MEITYEQLARAAGEPVERVREWHAAGLLGTTGPELTLVQLEHARLIGFLERRGVSLDAIAAHRGEIEHFIARTAGRAAACVGTLADAAARTGLDPVLAERVWTATGLPPADLLDERDLEFLRGWRTVHDVGHPDEAVVELARVMGDTVTRVTEAMGRITHFHVIRPLVDGGLADAALGDAIGQRTGQLIPLAPRLLAYLTERLLATASRENFALRLLHDRSEPGQLLVAIAFVDLCSFTPLADVMGDRESADVLGRFSDLVRRVIARHEGRVVKQIGDAFMLVFVEPRAAVACLVDIERTAAAEPRFPAVRGGVQWGPVLYRDADYVGANANLAARVAAEAGRHEILVTEAVRRAAAPVADVEFRPLARRKLKGISEEVELFQAVPAAPRTTGRLVDPVCGMEMSPTEPAARLTLGARELAFCSAQCLQRYVAQP